MNALPEPTRPRAGSSRRSARRCIVCGRRLHSDTLLLEETHDVPDPQSWAVCPACYATIRSEVERSALQTPMRLRIAIGVVAARHERPARYSMFDDRFWDQLTDEGLNRLLIWVFAVAFGVHAIAFVLVAVYITVAH